MARIASRAVEHREHGVRVGRVGRDVDEDSVAVGRAELPQPRGDRRVGARDCHAVEHAGLQETCLARFLHHAARSA